MGKKTKAVSKNDEEVLVEQYRQAFESLLAKGLIIECERNHMGERTYQAVPDPKGHPLFELGGKKQPVFKTSRSQ